MTMIPLPKELALKDQRLNSRQIALALGNKSTWLVQAVKKSNKILAAQGKEELIFSGRYSTPGKVSAWLDDHPGFVAGHILAPKRSPGNPAPKRGKTKSRHKGRPGARLLDAYDRSLQTLVSELERRIPGHQLAGALTVWRAVCAKRKWPCLPAASLSKNEIHAKEAAVA
jgi:hypothetical protein